MPTRTASAAGNHAVRIVPLAVPAGLVEHVAGVPAAQPPNLVYRGGELLTDVQVFTIFLGAAWAGPQQQLTSDLNAFFTSVLIGELLDQLGEYDTGPYVIGHGRLLGTRTLPNTEPAPSVTDAWIQSTLRALTASGGQVPAPAKNLLYFIYLPPGVTLVQGGSRSCQSFCGYHDHIDRQWFYAAMPYPNCAGCLGSLAALDALTSTSSHELCEAITDPVPGEGWYDDANGEIGDICSWQTRKIGQSTVQLEWSNRDNRCE